MDGTSKGIRALERLHGPRSELRNELVGHCIDHLLAQRVRDVVDLEQVRALVASALTEANVTRIVQRHVHPGWQRYAQAIASSAVRVGALVPERARPRLAAIAVKVGLPRARWAKGAVDPALVRRLLAPVWTQVLISFASLLPIPGLAGSGGKRGALGMAELLARSVQGGAEKLLDRGRSWMGGLGIDFERRLLEAARGFSDNAADIFRDALRERLASEEGRELLGRIDEHLLDHVLDTTFADLQRDADELPLDDVFEVAPAIIAHAAKTAYVQDIVQREIAAYLAAEGGRTLQSLVDELGIGAELRAVLQAHGEVIARGFFASPAFASWLSRLLDDEDGAPPGRKKTPRERKQ
jgi:hypothetical protein